MTKAKALIDNTRVAALHFTSILLRFPTLKQYSRATKMGYMYMLDATVPANIRIKRCSVSSARPSLGDTLQTPSRISHKHKRSELAP